MRLPILIVVSSLILSASLADPLCDAEIKEIDSYQMGVNLNLSRSSTPHRFELLQHHNIFSIHASSGLLQAVRNIDRESICQPNTACDCLKPRCFMEITVLIFDLRRPNKSPERVSKSICIDDINDNKPTFPESIQSVELNEYTPIGTQLELYSAQDLDSYGFSINRYSLKCPVDFFNLSYNIMKGNMYRVDHQIKLIVTHNISFRIDPIQCILEACDLDSCSSMRLVIKVNDVNDHKPEWSKSSYFFKIKENIPLDSVIHTFQATDLDTVFGKISYSIQKIILRDVPKTFLPNLFTIDSNSGDLKVNGNIDYEDRLNRRFIIILVAKDNGIPSLSSSTSMTIDVEDVNDCAPIIHLNRVVIEVEENSNLSYLNYFTVHDNDDMANGIIECEILDSSEFFKLLQPNSNIPITYEIHLKTPLDHEKQSLISITIQCQDGGKPNQSSRKRIIVNVIDVNDNQVYFAQRTTEISIPENTPIGMEIIRLSTVDLDKKSDVVYSFVNPNNSYVNIDSQAGYLTTNEIFDREVKSEYSFQVQVMERDNTNFTDIANVILRITDINDNKPIFKDFYTFSIPENASVEGLIGRVQATDGDLGENGTIVYSQENQLLSHPTYFTVSNTGEIRLFNKLDVDKQSIHQIIVVAKDQGAGVPLSSSTTVFVTVLDSNNNPPRFNDRSSTLSLSCQTQTIDKISFPVTDKDKTPENTRMSYQIDGVKPSKYKPFFSIDKISGKITMTIQKDQCDFKLRDKEKVEILILVYDPTKPEFRDKASLYLYLDNEKYQKNINDNVNSRHNQGQSDFYNKKIKVPFPEADNSVKQEDYIDHNITIIIVLIFVTIFLGIFLISVICFVRKKRSPEEGQDLDENTIIVREKVNPSIQSSKSDYNDHADSYQMPLKKMVPNTIRYSTMTENLRNKNSKLDVNTCTSSVQSVEEQLDKKLFNYEMAKIKDNNSYQSLTMNSKLSNLESDFVMAKTFSSSPKVGQHNKTMNMIQYPSQISQPTDRSYFSISFV